MQPNLIIGDLDSLRLDVKQHYLEAGVPLIDLSHDQDSTDLEKCLEYLQANVLPPSAQPQSLNEEGGERSGASGQVEKREIDDRPQILVLGAFGGRLDHTLSNLNALYQFRHLNIVLWGEGNLVRLIRGPGDTLLCPEGGTEGPSCGLVCLGEPCVASSRGMKWDLNETRMNIGGLLSTCNKILGEEVWVKTDRDLIWITTISTEWGC